MDLLQSCQYNFFSGGVTLGLAAFPVSFDNGSRLGLYVDRYRGSQIYKDFYNQPEFEVPGSSYGNTTDKE